MAAKKKNNPLKPADVWDIESEQTQVGELLKKIGPLFHYHPKTMQRINNAIYNRESIDSKRFAFLDSKFGFDFDKNALRVAFDLADFSDGSETLPGNINRFFKTITHRIARIYWNYDDKTKRQNFPYTIEWANLEGPHTSEILVDEATFKQYPFLKWCKGELSTLHSVFCHATYDMCVNNRMQWNGTEYKLFKFLVKNKLATQAECETVTSGLQKIDRNFVIVFSRNPVDYVFCSTGQSYSSCMGLFSQHSAAYYFGNLALTYDPNRYIVYVQKRKNGKLNTTSLKSIFKDKSVASVKAKLEIPRMIRRAFVLVNNKKTHFVIREYPHDNNITGKIKSVVTGKFSPPNGRLEFRRGLEKYPLPLFDEVLFGNPSIFHRDRIWSVIGGGGSVYTNCREVSTQRGRGYPQSGINTQDGFFGFNYENYTEKNIVNCKHCGRKTLRHTVVEAIVRTDANGGNIETLYHCKKCKPKIVKCYHCGDEYLANIDGHKFDGIKGGFSESTNDYIKNRLYNRMFLCNSCIDEILGQCSVCGHTYFKRHKITSNEKSRMAASQWRNSKTNMCLDCYAENLTLCNHCGEYHNAADFVAHPLFGTKCTHCMESTVEIFEKLKEKRAEISYAVPAELVNTDNIKSGLRVVAIGGGRTTGYCNLGWNGLMTKGRDRAEIYTVNTAWKPYDFDKKRIITVDCEWRHPHTDLFIVDFNDDELEEKYADLIRRFSL